jgi:hypothetical protein
MRTQNAHTHTSKHKKRPTHLYSMQKSTQGNDGVVWAHQKAFVKVLRGDTSTTGRENITGARSGATLAVTD